MFRGRTGDRPRVGELVLLSKSGLRLQPFRAGIGNDLKSIPQNTFRKLLQSGRVQNLRSSVQMSDRGANPRLRSGSADHFRSMQKAPDSASGRNRPISKYLTDPSTHFFAFSLRSIGLGELRSVRRPF